jgi:hypothetical protein
MPRGFAILLYSNVHVFHKKRVMCVCVCVEVPVLMGSLEVQAHPRALTPSDDPTSGEPTRTGTSPTSYNNCSTYYYGQFNLARSQQVQHKIHTHTHTHSHTDLGRDLGT